MRKKTAMIPILIHKEEQLNTLKANIPCFSQECLFQIIRRNMTSHYLKKQNNPRIFVPRKQGYYGDFGYYTGIQ